MGIRFREIRERTARARQVAAKLNEVLRAEESAVAKTKKSISKVNESKVLLRLAELPIETLREATDSPLRIETLRKYGFTSIASVYHASNSQLERLSGISSEAAEEIKTIAIKIYEAIADSTDFTFNIEDIRDEGVEVLENLQEVESIRAKIRGKREKLQETVSELSDAVRKSDPFNSRLRWWLTRREVKENALAATSNLAILLGDPVTATLIELADAAIEARKNAQEISALQDFEKRSSDYYATLDEIVGRSKVLGDNALNAELIERIEAQEVDLALIKVTLRRYQVFGAKFALTQGRVILGDEMGLGKTIQAIAAIAQRHQGGAIRSLVICPASVLVNWQREFAERSDLSLIKIHGTTQKSGLAEWRAQGGIGLTTFDTLKSFDLTDPEIRELEIDTVVVDEAHYVKNLETGRSRTVSKWLKDSPNVLFLTGTPLENRVNEFVNLAHILDSQFANSLNRFALAAGAETFRKSVAPMYLRRNAADVLKELPEQINVNEFCDWSGADYDFYVKSVQQGNFMAMRRAAFRELSPGVIPSKLNRLLEITREAFDSGQKVVIFSFFREVLSAIHTQLAQESLEPITGSINPSRRQSLIDEFREAKNPLALIGQIQAAGTGLNIQAASVVILCEPQIKPSLETQAIARARRMGQIRNVQVHRLIIPESVDTQMLALLKDKQDEFDAFARDSALADSADGAKDDSEESIVAKVLEEERRRLGVDVSPTR